MAKNYIIFRHGPTYFSERNLEYGDKKLTEPILPEGRPLIEKLAKHLKDVSTDINLRSDVYRCIQTAQVVTEISGKEFSEDKRLTEYNEETFADLRTRVADFLNEMEKTDLENICVCTHGAVLSAMKHLILYNKFELPDLHDYPETGVIWIIKNGQIEEISFR